jgi:regulator of sigma E protease
LLSNLHMILAFVLLLAVMIVVHELGHYWAAVAVGIRVETFSIGFGPRLFGFRRGDTDFRVSLIPLGGYVRMLGEQPGDDQAIDPASFQAKARWQRAIVIMAGPLMNIILAVLLLTGLYMYKFPRVDESGPSIVTEIEPNSAAAKAGLQIGDRILQFGDQANPTWDYLGKQASFNGNHAMDVAVLRNGQRLNLSVTPEIDPKEGIGVIGWGYGNIEVTKVEQGEPAQVAGIQVGDIFLSVDGHAVVSRTTVRDVVAKSEGRQIDVQVRRHGASLHFAMTPAKFKDHYRIGVVYGESVPFPIQWVKLPFPDAVGQSLRENREYTVLVFETLRGILQQRVSPKSMSGPIGIARASADMFEEGPWYYMKLMAAVSLNLAIFNLLPIPILDGGTLLLLFVEMLLQREVSMRVKETALKLGFVFLMMVVVFVFYNDLTRPA